MQVVGYRLYIVTIIIIMTSRKRTALFLVNIVEAVEKGDKSRDVAKEFSVAWSTVSLLCCKKSMIKKAVESQKLSPHRKNVHGAKHKDIEEALLLWFKQARTMNVPISVPILQVKAKELASPSSWTLCVSL